MTSVRRFLRYDFPIIVALFVLPLAFFWQVTVGNRTLLPADNLYQFQPWAAYREQEGVPAVPHNALLSDLVLENLPWKQFIRDSLARREIPLWNPYIFAGVPFLAAGQHSALYPFSIIYYVLPLEKAYGWFTVSQLWLAGLFMYLFMRGLGVGRFGGTIAAIAFQLSGFFIASVVFQMIIAAGAWLPFLLLMVEFTIQRRAVFGKPTVIPWIGLGAFGLGMEILAGHVEFTYYALLVMGFWSACRLLHLALRRTDRVALPALIRPAAALIALVVLGVGVGSIQFIPLFELSSHNFRAGSTSFADVRSYGFPPRHALAFLMPNLYGSPAQHDYLNVFTGQQTPVDWTSVSGGHVTDTYWEPAKNYVEGACYVGLLTLILAAIALLNARFERAPHAKIETVGPYRAILALLAAISLTFVFGTITYAILYYGLPGINQLHSPFRWVFPLTLCLAALAGFGAEALQRARGESTFGAEYWRNGAATSFTFRLAKWLGWALIWSGSGVLIVLALSRIFFERLRGPLGSLFHRLTGAETTFPSVDVFYSVSFRPILFFGLFLLSCGCVIRVSRCPIYLPKRFGGRPIWQAMALVILTLDLVVASAGFNPAADPAWLHFVPPAIQWLQAQNPQDWRFTAVEGTGTHTMNANVGWLYGLQDVRGYDSIIPKQYVDYMQNIQAQTQLIYNRIAPLFPDLLKGTRWPNLNELGVKYIVSDIPLDTSQSGAVWERSVAGSMGLVDSETYHQVYQDQAVFIYENSQVYPRAYTIGASQTKQCIAGRGAGGWLLGETDPGDPAKAKTKIVESSDNQVVINTTGYGDPNVDPDVINVKYDGYPPITCLVLADSYYPGWRAYIKPQGATDDKEKEVPVIQMFNNFRGIYIPPGDWTVRFRFSPPSVQIGAFVSFIAGVIIIFMGLLWLWGLFYTEDTSVTGGVRRFAKNSIAPIFLNLFNRGIDLAFALVMLRILGPENAGTYTYAIVIFGWFDTITNFGLNLLLTREVARDRAAAGRYLLNSSILRLLLAGTGVPFLIVFCVIRLSSSAPGDNTPLALMALGLLYVGLIPNSISSGLTALFYSFEKAEIPAATSTVSAILKTVFGLAVLLAGWGVLGLAGVSILLNVITLSILGVQARRLLRRHADTDLARDSQHKAVLDWKLIRDMVAASWPLMLNNLLAGVFFKIDVTILEPQKGAKVVGQYGTAYKWLDALGVIPSLFTMALLPIMSRQARDDKPGLERNYQFAIKLLISLALPAAVGIAFIAYPLISILGGSQYLPDGAIALQLMVWFIPIGWINSLTNYVLIALDQQHAMRWAFAVGVAFNLITNLIFIPLYSYKAAAVITVLSEIVLQIAFYRLLRKALAPLPWIQLLWKPALAAACMLGIALVLSPIVGILAPVIGGGVYVVLLVGLRPFSAWEWERLLALLPKRLRLAR